MAVTAFKGLLAAVRPTLCSKGKNGEQSRNQAIKKSCSHPKLHALLISWLLKRAGTEHDCVSSLLEALPGALGPKSAECPVCGLPNAIAEQLMPASIGLTDPSQAWTEATQPEDSLRTA